MSTARQIIDEEVIQWLEKEELAVLGRSQLIPHMEDVARVWEYGKWCVKGGWEQLGYKPQIKFRGSRPESTAWDAIQDISDDEGMLIHAAMLTLERRHRNLLHLIYLRWVDLEDARRIMKLRRETFYDMRWSALNTIANYLQNHA